MTFDVILANPPYSIKQWNREGWASDPWGRNFLGTPPQGRADYAFFQHILKSMSPSPGGRGVRGEGGRCAILFPHGVLFRKEEAEMRQKLVEADLVECVLGLGPNLFYNSPMEACIVICRNSKPTERQGKVLFIDALEEITRERSMSLLKPEHQERIANAYGDFADEESFTHIANLEEIAAQDYSLSIPLYVKRNSNDNGLDKDDLSLHQLWNEWEQDGQVFWREMDQLTEYLTVGQFDKTQERLTKLNANIDADELAADIAKARGKRS